MKNLEMYNKLRSVPAEAQKPINAGRIKGMTDINPMWRIKVLTENFGMCGIGWKYVITKKALEQGCKEQISAFVDIDLYVKVDGEWSAAIPGTGGASFVTDELKGLYQSDECFKMALTDAISVACKALGVGADIYFGKDRTKYDVPEQNQQSKSVTQQVVAPKRLTKEQMAAIPTSTNLESLKAALKGYALDDNQKQIISARIKDLENELYLAEEQKKIAIFENEYKNK